MNILLISPIGFPITPTSKYVGIERLVWEYSKELIRLGNSVAVIGHTESVFPDAVTLLPCSDETRGFQAYQHCIRDYDIVHDFSHLHLASRFMPNLPSLNIFWHAPNLAQYPKSPYNIVALSAWAARQFRRFYNQEARYQQSIVIDPSVYKPKGTRTDRFLTIGRMSPEKGNLNALMLCKKAGVPLDIAGGRGLEREPDTPLTDYELAILGNCDGDNYRFLGEVSEDEKLKLMQSCRALIYATNHPEVTSHKIQESLFTSAPAIVPRLGALPEIVTQGVNGYLCSTESEYLEAISSVDKLTPLSIRQQFLRRFATRPVIRAYLKLYKRVANGERW